MVISARLPLYFLGLAAVLAAANPPVKTYTIQTIAGSDLTLEGGPALEAAFSQTEGIAVNGLGAIYVADAGDNRVRKITPDGAIQTVAGTGVSGFAGDGGPANAAQLSHPYGLAVDAAGNLYIADLGNARVRKVSTDGTIQTVAGGGIIVPGGNDVPALSAQLTQPRNLALDADSTLYVSDFGAHRVYRVTKGTLATLAGTGNAGFSGDNALANLAQLNSPAGIASDSNGSVFIADSGNNRIRKVTRGVITTVYTINGPTGIAFSTGGFLYIAAAGYFGTQFRAIAGFASARDVAVDLAGNVYATTGQLVRKLTSDGKVSTVAGSGTARFFGGDNGPAAAAKLHQPSGIAVDEAGNWYIADTANNRIRRISAGGVISTIAGTGDAGSSGDTGQATLAQLNAPRSVAIDSQHNIYIADTGNNRVRKITPAGIMMPVDAKLNDPEYVTIDLDGSLYIADAGNDRILKVTASGVQSTAGQALKPAAVLVDRAGNIYVSEPTRVSKISSTGTVTTVLDALNAPRGLALTEDGDLMIAEAGGHVIRRVPASGAPVAIAGTGAPGFSGDGGASATAQLNSPADVVVDLSGTIWVADSGNNRIRTLTPSAVVAPIVASATVVHAATMAPGPIAPGEIITIFGAGFDPNRTQLLFDGKPATVFYADSAQINALAPGNLSPNATTAVTIQAKGATVAGFSSKVVSAVPGIFTVSNGAGQAAASNEDGTVNSASNPAPRGSIVTLYATGEGQIVSTVGLKIGGYTAELLYTGPAPGFQGLMQINARVPAGFAPAGILSVLLSVGNATSQDGVTIAVR